MKMTIKLTSEQPCQIPAIGEFEAGETKVLDEYTQTLFASQFGYPVQSGMFPTWVTCEVSFENEETVEDEEEA